MIRVAYLISMIAIQLLALRCLKTQTLLIHLRVNFVYIFYPTKERSIVFLSFFLPQGHIKVCQTTIIVLDICSSSKSMMLEKNWTIQDRFSLLTSFFEFINSFTLR